VSISSATEDIDTATRAATVPVVKTLTDAIASDTVTTTGRIHNLPIFDGTKKKWPA
jgi:hypothetical protein